MTATDAIRAAKRALRAEVRARLGEITESDRDRAGERVAAGLWSLPEFSTARVILLFSALPDEVSTLPIAIAAWGRGIRVAYPRTEREPRRLVLHDVGDPDQLRPGNWGILEPAADARPLDTSEVDAALIPGLAWDRTGARLGRGAGFYDRLLADPAWRGFRCGVYFAAQQVDSVPTEPWDAHLDAVVTEAGVWRFGGTAEQAFSP